MGYYDRIADIYDKTRWLPESVAEEVADFIIKRVNATPETSFLEPGVGTGLNVLPLVKRGYSVTGVDVSEAMLDQFRHKFNPVPSNLTLIRADASRLPFPDQCFDVVLTVHMVHAVSDWKLFLDEVDRVLKPQGFYLNAQWITPPARLEFEQYFKTILAKYDAVSQRPEKVSQSRDYLQRQEINIEEYLQHKGYRSNYAIVKEWTVSNTVNELLSFFRSRAYGLCWRVSDGTFQRVMEEFEAFCTDHYDSLDMKLASKAKFEMWTYTANELG